jgi:hypothetical protein
MISWEFSPPKRTRGASGPNHRLVAEPYSLPPPGYPERIEWVVRQQCRLIRKKKLLRRLPSVSSKHADRQRQDFDGVILDFFKYPAKVSSSVTIFEHSLPASDANIRAFDLLVHPRSRSSARIGSPTSQANEAAEALFRPKPERIKRPDDQTSPSAPPLPRTSRILSVSAGASVSQKAESDQAQPAGLEILVSQIPRIKTWLKYGMTVPQVAKIYGVARMISSALSRKADAPQILGG